MPWKEMDVMDERIRFVVRANSGQESMVDLCREFGISRPTGYLWLERYRDAESTLGLGELSRRPHDSPGKISVDIERKVVALRNKHGWGGKKIGKLLGDRGVLLPLITINRIIKRNGLINRGSSHRPATRRFERALPNELWQMDFKGEFGLIGGGYCYPLTLIDDHSRFALGVFALNNRRGKTVWGCLMKVFERYGVPQGMLMDHGTPWWSATNGHGLTGLGIDLIKQGIKLHWSGIAHPQTQGKIERFHRTLKEDIYHLGKPETLKDWQKAFAGFIKTYNHLRPHEALAMAVPAKYYNPSPKPFNPHPAEWQYPQGAIVKRLNSQGMIEYKGRRYFVCEALADEYVQLELIDKKALINYRLTYIREIELKTGKTKTILKPKSNK
jgi:transposase InsO family protein